MSHPKYPDFVQGEQSPFGVAAAGLRAPSGPQPPPKKIRADPEHLADVADAVVFRISKSKLVHRQGVRPDWFGEFQG
jgi:hypothetical protein